MPHSLGMAYSGIFSASFRNLHILIGAGLCDLISDRTIWERGKHQSPFKLALAAKCFGRSTSKNRVRQFLASHAVVATRDGFRRRRVADDYEALAAPKYERMAARSVGCRAWDASSFLTQLLGFGGQKHDDAVDALVYLILGLIGDGMEEQKIQMSSTYYRALRSCHEFSRALLIAMSSTNRRRDRQFEGTTAPQSHSLRPEAPRAQGGR